MSLNCHCAPKDAHLSFVEQRDGEQWGYNCSCLPCLADLTLIRITLREHDRWESSYIHTETHMCTDVGPHTHMFKQCMNKWILRWFFVLYLREKKKGRRTSREGQLALQSYIVMNRQRVWWGVSHKLATRKIIQLKSSLLLPRVCHHFDEVRPTELFRWSKSLLLLACVEAGQWLQSHDEHGKCFCESTEAEGVLEVKNIFFIWADERGCEISTSQSCNHSVGARRWKALSLSCQTLQISPLITILNLLFNLRCHWSSSRYYHMLSKQAMQHTI